MKFIIVAMFIAAIGTACVPTLEAQTAPADFRKVVEKRLNEKKLKLANICPVDTNVVARRVFKDYGAMFIADSSVKFPPKCVFESDEDVLAFQNTIPATTKTINGTSVTLQEEAMKAFEAARAEAAKSGLNISPRGASSSKRSYVDTARIWKSRFDPALKYWIGKGKIVAADAEKARKMATIDQVERVMEWEEDKIWFSTRFNYSIFSSVAAPGTSQHLSMIALDVEQFANKDAKAILNRHGWFQTIIDDLPHFTFLGRDESDLPKYGLRPETRDGVKFWIPNFDR
jgi:hypothetical protein